MLAANVTAQAQLNTVESWGYVLGDVDPVAVAASGFDMVVVDYSRDGSADGELGRSEVAAMQRKPDGSRRLVLAYLSIGEAETYRYYWKSAWQRNRPAWLADENPNWAGNIKVRYWDPEWQSLIFGAQGAYIDKIVEAGFDGVYLDLIDAFEHFENRRPTARAEMTRFVADLSRYAKRTRGREFLVIGQNGESLVSEPDYLAAIDGVAKEDLYFSYETDGVPAEPADTRESLAFLKRAQAAGKRIFVVDYVSKREAIERTYHASRAQGFVPYASARDLDRLVINDQVDPASDSAIAAAIDDDFGEARFSDALLFATTLPRGSTEVSVFSDYFTERYEFSTLDANGQENDFFTDEFYEWTNSVSIRHALTDQFEIGVRFPVVQSSIDAPRVEGRHSGFRRSETGLGNIGILSAYGIELGTDDSDILLLDAELGLPTDQRSEDFAGGGNAFVSLTYEHYWHRLGITAIGSTDYFADSGFSGGQWTLAYLVGPSFQFTDRLYVSALLGQRDDFDVLQMDVSASLLLTPRSSLEVSWGRDLDGPAKASFVGVGVNYVFGGR